MELLQYRVETADINVLFDAGRALDHNSSIGMNCHNLKRTVFRLQFVLDVVVKMKNKVIRFIGVCDAAFVFPVIVCKVTAAAVIDVTPVCQ
eukprot:13730057-Ditylum_brightwellii.AAC.1